MLIRAATVNDLPAWSAMRTALWPDTDDGHVKELNQFFANESIDIEQCFVGEIDGIAIAFIELNIRNFAEGSRNNQVPYVEGWYVSPEFQQQGFGTKLMQHAEQWALSLGFNELASDTEIDNHSSIKKHKALGFVETERVVCFLKQLT